MKKYLLFQFQVKFSLDVMVWTAVEEDTETQKGIILQHGKQPK